MTILEDIRSGAGQISEEKLEDLMRIAKDTKKEFHYCRFRSKWLWSERGEEDLIGTFDTFFECLCDAVELYLEDDE